MKKRNRKRGREGFTLIEVIASTALLMVTATGFLMMTGPIQVFWQRSTDWTSPITGSAPPWRKKDWEKPQVRAGGEFS